MLRILLSPTCRSHKRCCCCSPRTRPQELLAAATSPSPGLLAGAVANSCVYVLGIRVLLAGLTWQGVASSWVLGTLSYAAFGAGGYALVCAYFVVGSLVGVCMCPGGVGMGWWGGGEWFGGAS